MRGKPQDKAGESCVRRAENADPPPIERYDVAHPAVPEALDGLTILHLSDTHITRGRFGGSLDRSLLGALDSTPVDLVALTGDYMSRPGDEPVAIDALSQMARAWRARLGAFGVFGNHDTAGFRDAVRAQVHQVRWLEGEACIEDQPLRLLGANDPEDLLGAVLASDRPDRRFTVTLAHQPSAIYPAATLGLPLVLTGHTHGGQIRITRRRLLHTAGDLPGDRASGALRLGGTLCCVSRGLGEMLLPIRFNCPRQAPLYVLRSAVPSRPGGAGLERLIAW